MVGIGGGPLRAIAQGPANEERNRMSTHKWMPMDEENVLKEKPVNDHFKYKLQTIIYCLQLVTS